MPTIKKIVVLVAIISLVGGIFVYTANQTQAMVFLYQLKEFIINPLVRKLANALENKLVNKINGLVSGLDQKIPSFIINWRNYTLDSQARGNDIFRSVLADAKLCPYFKTNLQTAFGADKYIGALSGANINKTSIPGLPSFQNLANCTLPANLNINIFKTDFAKGGGWDTWNKLIQPQNNFFGAYALSLAEQQNQIQTEKESARDTSIAGQGFLGQKLGTGGAAPNGCTGSTLSGGAGRCIWFGKEVTPPKFLGDLSVKSLDTKIGRVGAAQELTDVILSLVSAVVTGLSNKILNFTGQGSYDVAPGGGTGFNETIPKSSSFVKTCLEGCDKQFKQELKDNDCPYILTFYIPTNQCYKDAAQNRDECRAGCLQLIYDGSQECNTACYNMYNQCVNNCPRDPNYPTIPGAQCASDCLQRLNQCDDLCPPGQ